MTLRNTSIASVVQDVLEILVSYFIFGNIFHFSFLPGTLFEILICFQDWPHPSLMIRTATSLKIYWTSWWRPNRRCLPGLRTWPTSTSTRAPTVDALRGTEASKLSRHPQRVCVFSRFMTLLFFCRFSGGFGARDYRQIVGGANVFGNRGARNTGGNRGFGGNKG